MFLAQEMSFDLAEWVAGISPWVFLTVGVAVVLADVFLVNIYYLAWVGMATASLGVMSWCGASGEVMIFSFHL